MITLYGMSSPNVRKVAIMLEEQGLEHELVHVPIMRAAQYDPAFAAFNPLRKVPVLVDGDGPPLFESGAILIYLAETHGGGFLPERGPRRQQVIQWLMVQMAHIGPMLGQNNHFRLVPPDGNGYARARYAQQSATIYRLIDDRLAERPWIAGDAYSIADIALWPWAMYLELHGFDPAEHPALVRWRDAVAARPAVARANARFKEAYRANDDHDRRAATPAELDLFFNRTERVPPADYSAIAR